MEWRSSIEKPTFLEIGFHIPFEKELETKSNLYRVDLLASQIGDEIGEIGDVNQHH